MGRQQYHVLSDDGDAGPAVIELQEDRGYKGGESEVPGNKPYERAALNGSSLTGAGLPDADWWLKSRRRACESSSYLVCGLLLMIIAGLSVAVTVLAAALARQSGDHRGEAGYGNDDLRRLPTFPPTVDTSRDACNGNGIQYLFEATCDCFPCFAGPTCADAVPLRDCNISADSGTPLIFEDYWVMHPEPEIRVRASDHIGYVKRQSVMLEDLIRKLHAMAGNAITEGRRIVIGHGSSQLLHAALFAMSDRDAPEPVVVYSEAPYYNAYRIIAQYYNSTLFRWHDGPGPPADAARVVEFVTSPNNPDGRLRNRTVAASGAVFDHAYLWPHFTPVSGPVLYGDRDIALFTLSKLTGHAGSRIGWAVVKDEALAERLARHVEVDHWIVVENQLRAIAVLQYVLGTQGDIFSYSYREMARRWDVLQRLFSTSDRFAIQELEPAAYDTWFQRQRGPSPAYLWLTCTHAQRDPDCWGTLASVGVIGRPGGVYGGTASQVRIELLMRAETFDKMMVKLQDLVK